nr:hypothetical protein CFP56_06989 [Quercus suber]
MKAKGFLVCVCASDEARGFFEAFHTLLAFLISFLAALIGLHFQVLGVSPLETHFALILLFIIATIVYSIAYAEIKLQPPDADLPIFRFICLVSGVIAIELLVAIIISPFWLFMAYVEPQSFNSNAAVTDCVTIRLKVLISKAFYGLFNSLKAAVNLVIRLRDSILEALYHLLNSDEALGFFEAFHELLAYLVSFLAALIGLHFQVLGVSPLETHFAIILLLIMATIIYSIAYVEIKLLPRNADLPLFRNLNFPSNLMKSSSFATAYVLITSCGGQYSVLK